MLNLLYTLLIFVTWLFGSKKIHRKWILFNHRDKLCISTIFDPAILANTKLTILYRVGAHDLLRMLECSSNTHACLQRIFQCGCVYLHFTYNDIYICYTHSSHLISIIKCHHRLPQWQCP